EFTQNQGCASACGERTSRRQKGGRDGSRHRPFKAPKIVLRLPCEVKAFQGAQTRQEGEESEPWLTKEILSLLDGVRPTNRFQRTMHHWARSPHGAARSPPRHRARSV